MVSITECNGKKRIVIDCRDAMLFGALFFISGLVWNMNLWFSDFTLRALVGCNLLLVFRSFHSWFNFVITELKPNKDVGK